jgi:hypothetical protein
MAPFVRNPTYPESVCVFVFVNCVHNVCGRECTCCVHDEYLPARSRANVYVLCMCQCSSCVVWVLVYMYIGMCVLFCFSVLQSFFANCNAYSMMWYTWGKKRWFFPASIFCLHRLNNNNSMELSFGMILYTISRWRWRWGPHAPSRWCACACTSRSSRLAPASSSVYSRSVIIYVLRPSMCTVSPLISHSECKLNVNSIASAWSIGHLMKRMTDDL